MEKKIWKKNLPKRRPIYRFTMGGNDEYFTGKGEETGTSTLITTVTAVFNAFK